MQLIEEQLALDRPTNAAVLFVGSAKEVERQEREWIEAHGPLSGLVLRVTIGERPDS